MFLSHLSVNHQWKISLILSTVGLEPVNGSDAVPSRSKLCVVFCVEQFSFKCICASMRRGGGKWVDWAVSCPLSQKFEMVLVFIVLFFHFTLFFFFLLLIGWARSMFGEPIRAHCCQSQVSPHLQTRGLIYNCCICPTQGLKEAYSPFYADVLIYKKEEIMCAPVRKI